MTRTQSVWLTQAAYDRLQQELALLTGHRPVGPEESGAAPAEGPDLQYILDGAARQARIQKIQDLLGKAVVGEEPPDDGVAEPGMVLTVRYEDEEETDTFLLGVRDGAESGDLKVYSAHSPMGTALTGARQGEQRRYQAPNGRTVRVTLLKAEPYGKHRRP